MQKIIITAVAAILLSITSCKKKDIPVPPPIQKIYLKSFGNASGSFTYNFFYDNQNRLQRLEEIEPTFTNITSNIQFGANNNITEYITRTPSAVLKYILTYDGQNRLLTKELRDSLGPTNFRLRTTYTYTYPANKQIRTINNHLSSTIFRNEYTYNSEGNSTGAMNFNNSGANTSNTVYSNYDNKISPDGLMPIAIWDFIPSKNNAISLIFTDVARGTSTTYTYVYTYNSDNYPTQATYTNLTTGVQNTINYTYEKR